MVASLCFLYLAVPSQDRWKDCCGLSPLLWQQRAYPYSDTKWSIHLWRLHIKVMDITYVLHQFAKYFRLKVYASRDKPCPSGVHGVHHHYQHRHHPHHPHHHPHHHHHHHHHHHYHHHHHHHHHHRRHHHQHHHYHRNHYHHHHRHPVINGKGPTKGFWFRNFCKGNKTLPKRASTILFFLWRLTSNIYSYSPRNAILHCWDWEWLVSFNPSINQSIINYF